MINIFYFIYEINRTGPGGARALVYFLPLLEIIFSVSFFIHFFFATSGTLKIRVVEIENMREYQFIFVCYEKRGFLYSRLLAIVWIRGLQLLA